MKTMTKTILTVFCASTLLSCVASATLHTFTISLDPAQATTSDGSATGSGSGTATYDDVSGILSWSFSVSGLSGTVNDADFHAPAAPGATAMPVIDAFGGYSGSGEAGSGSGSFEVYSPPGELLGNLWYLNIRTNTYINGEIRGQLIRVIPPAPPRIDYSREIEKLYQKIYKIERRIDRLSRFAALSSGLGNEFRRDAFDRADARANKKI